MDPGIATVVATSITSILALVGAITVAMMTRDSAVQRKAEELTKHKDDEIRRLRKYIFQHGGDPDEA